MLHAFVIASDVDVNRRVAVICDSGSGCSYSVCIVLGGLGRKSWR
jgi:predicted ABC-type transport system involved in lysophospholipase L1 biosynthesis ATPase subunit